MLYLGREDAEESDNDADGEKNEAPHSTPVVSSFFILLDTFKHFKQILIMTIS